MNMKGTIRIFNRNIVSVSKVLYLQSSTESITIPQLNEANTIVKMGMYKGAINLYKRVMEIIDSSQISKSQLGQKINNNYLQAASKCAACSYIEGQYNDANKYLSQVINKNEGSLGQYDKYIHFLLYSASSKNQTKNQDIPKQQVNRQIFSIVNQLFGHNQSNAQYRHLPILGLISNNLNNGLDYRKILTNLIQRSSKAQKTQKPNQLISSIISLNPHAELQLLLHLGIILTNNPVLKSADKVFINNQVNGILKVYEQVKPQQVYKALLNITLSLIAQNHYMSAQGITGHIKNQQNPTIKNQSDEKNLINNIYRMLVTRANNQPYENGWAKEKQVKLGDLVIDRIVKAPLLGHTVTNLIN